VKVFKRAALQIGYYRTLICFLILLLFHQRPRFLRGPFNCDTVLRQPSRYTICIALIEVLAR
jgi:hypothetical protein